MSFYKEVPGRKTTLESTLKFDTEPKAGSTNPVTSESVKSAIDGAVGDAAAALQEQIDDIAEKAGSGYIPKGEATVATLNALSGQENGELYTMTDAGTLTDGSLAVVAGDTVAWDATNSVWYKAMDYAPRQYGTNEVHNLPTTITAFRTGDVIPVDGPSGTAKMGKDDLLKETAENALGSIHSLSDTATEADLVSVNYIPIDGGAGTKKLKAEDVAKRSVQDKDHVVVGDWNFARTITGRGAYALATDVVNGETYIAWRGSSTITKISFLDSNYQNAQDVTFGDDDFKIFTANGDKHFVLATSQNSQYGDVIIGNASIIFDIILKIQEVKTQADSDISRVNEILGSWNFAKDITTNNAERLDSDLKNGTKYLVWRSSNNITKVSFLNSSYQNAQDVTFGDDDFKIITANSDKRYMIPTSSDYSYGYVLVADNSIIRSVFEFANELKSRIAQVESDVSLIANGDVVFDRVCPATETYNAYTGLSFRAGVEYVVETDPTKVSKLLFMTSGYLHAVTINITSQQTKFSFDEDKGVMWVYSSSDASVVVHNLSVTTPFTNRFLINESVYEEVYYVGPNREVTSFTQMLRNLQGNTRKKVIYVDAGVYDIFEEIGGADFASAITGIANDWRDNSVIVPDNTRIVGLGDVTFNFLPANDDISDVGAQQLSPLNIENNVEVENITINADNCRYCIHSEMSALARNVDKHQKYKNVILNKMHTNKGWNQAFGCGFYKRAKFDFEGCVFTSWNQPISMHDIGLGANDGATINIKDCVFSTTNQNEVYALNFAEMSGTQTHHHVLLSNSRFNQSIRINRSLEYVTHNSFDVRAIGCGNITFSVSDLFVDNIYPPQDYS